MAPTRDAPPPTAEAGSAALPSAPPNVRIAPSSEGERPLGKRSNENGPGPPVPGASDAARVLSWRLRFRISGLEALSRLSWLGLRVTLRHLAGALHDGLRPADRAARRARRLERSAQQTVAVLGALKGAFAKAGQFAASRPDLVSREMQTALARLRDQVPPIPFWQARAVIEAELGRPLVDVFARVHMQPLGAASIAQVHLARLQTGEEVAVKVQYPWLRAALRSDLLLLRASMSGLLRLRGANRETALRLFDEFAAGLRDELDFEREADTARQIAANLASERRVIVPRVYAELSTRRLLVLERSFGVPLSDGESLRQAGIPPRAVLEVLANAYARQIFVDGLFHADPHPGNLFALPDPDDPQRPRVVFLDFGLSRRLAPELRRAIREAVFSLLKRDVDGFVAQMRALDMIAPGAEPGVRAAVEGMFEHMRSGGSVLDQSGSQVLALKDQAKSLLRDTPGLQLPTDLMLYAKTLSYLFALGESLDPEVDMMKLTVPYLLRFLAERDVAAPAATGMRSAAPLSAGDGSPPDAAPAGG